MLLPEIAPKVLALDILLWSNNAFILMEITHVDQETQLNSPWEVTHKMY